MRARVIRGLTFIGCITLVTIVMVMFVGPLVAVKAPPERSSATRIMVGTFDMVLVTFAGIAIYVTWAIVMRHVSLSRTRRLQWTLRQLFSITAAVGISCMLCLIIYERISGQWRYPTWLIDGVGNWLDSQSH
jgi:hypothetical protein